MESPHSILKKVFGYDSFRPGQEEIVSRLLAGQDVLAVMPTGAGIFAPGKEDSTQVRASPSAIRCRPCCCRASPSWSRRW